MQALMFEVKPKKGHEQHYFDRAAALRPRLAKNDGILFIDRYKSLGRTGIILSHSHWRDEASMTRWRVDEAHHKTQAAGRNVHFEDYRIRISHVLHYSLGAESAKIWSGDNAYLDPSSAMPRHLVIIGTEQGPYDDRGEDFQSVNFADRFLAVIEPDSEQDGRDLIADAERHQHVTSVLLSIVSRDYGMHDRDEAPQYFPPVRP
ncbi:MAG: antibiotic biosynthesis monooxygenase family protein [Geminicoccaceae bacterium]